MVGDGHVNKPPTLVRKNYEHEEHPKRDGRHDEESTAMIGSRDW